MHRLPILLLLSIACSQSTEPPTEPLEPLESVVAVHLRPHIDIPVPELGLESCLLGGGELIELDSVDNNDVTEHGDVVAFAVDPAGTLAAATVDGTIKLWSFDGFIAEIATGMLLYGPELSATESTDLVFRDDQLYAGDVRGLVNWLNRDGLMGVVGGTTPEIAVTAVAVNDAGSFLAHADTQAGGNIMVRALEGVEMFGPLASEITNVNDLAFLADGRLVAAGAEGLQLFEGSEFVGSFPVVDREIRELAVAGNVIAAVGDSRLSIVDATLLEERVSVEWHSVDMHTVALTENGLVALTAGGFDELRAWNTQTGEELAGVFLNDPISVRTDARGQLAFTASRDGALRAFGCE